MKLLEPDAGAEKSLRGCVRLFVRNVRLARKAVVKMLSPEHKRTNPNVRPLWYVVAGWGPLADLGQDIDQLVVSELGGAFELRPFDLRRRALDRNDRARG